MGMSASRTNGYGGFCLGFEGRGMADVDFQ
jgi:hypothetical protein